MSHEVQNLLDLFIVPLVVSTSFACDFEDFSYFFLSFFSFEETDIDVKEKKMHRGSGNRFKLQTYQKHMS